MLILHILRWLLFAAEIWIAAPILYLCILSLSAILATKKRQVEHINTSCELASPHFNFAILIPAHNEEAMLGTLLESLSLLAYPQDRYAIYVVADNCTDNTADLARATNGVHVYERFDELRRGKGYALNWLLQKLEENQLVYDAYVFFDADSMVEPNFLQTMATELAQGTLALQGRDSVLNSSASPSTALRWMALTLMDHVRPLGRNGLGASATLFGNAMCLSRTLLLRYPWEAFSLTEDYQYYLTLVEHGVRVHYVPEAIVRTHMPSTFAQMRTQDIRWESPGGGQTAWPMALRLLRVGLKTRDFVRIEAIAELLTPPLSFLACWCLFALGASLLVSSPLDLLVSLILVSGLVCHVGTAFYLVSPPRAVYKAFLYAPGFIIWKLWVYLVLRRSKKYTSEWVRTSRTISSK